MSRFGPLLEVYRSEVDRQGSAGCYRAAVLRFSRRFGIAPDGLWGAVEAYLRGDNPDRAIKTLIKAYGGDPNTWIKWFHVIAKEPGCPKH